jgi:hypothetical protein
MHQSVLEFVGSLAFKTIVLGDFDPFVGDKGHSFYIKYWTLEHGWASLNRHAI